MPENDGHSKGSLVEFNSCMPVAILLASVDQDPAWGSCMYK